MQSKKIDGMILYVIWYDVIWFDTIYWFDMIWYDTIATLIFTVIYWRDLTVGVLGVFLIALTSSIAWIKSECFLRIFCFLDCVSALPSGLREAISKRKTFDPFKVGFHNWQLLSWLTHVWFNLLRWIFASTHGFGQVRMAEPSRDVFVLTGLGGRAWQCTLLPFMFDMGGERVSYSSKSAGKSSQIAYISSSKGTVSKMLFWCCLGSKSSSSQVQSQTCSPWELWLSCFAWARPVFVYTMGFLRHSVETWLHQMAPWHWAAELRSLWT